MLYAWAQAATVINLDIKSLAKEEAKKLEQIEKINKKVVKEDKYLTDSKPEYEGIHKENKKQVSEFRRLPTKK